MSIAFGLKKHVEYGLTGDAIHIIAATESALGAVYADPPALPGRDGFDTKRLWSKAGVRREVEFVHGRQNDPNYLKPAAPWDADPEHPFPALRRFSATTPDILSSLPPELDAHFGTPFLEAAPDCLGGGGSLVAVDPGGDLQDWEGLLWFDRQTGQRVQVTTDSSVHPWDKVLLVSLHSKAATWGLGAKPRPVDGVLVDPLLVQFKGRVSGMIDADADGAPGDTSALRPDYGGADPAGFVVAEARRLGPTEFAKRDGLSLWTAKGITSGGRRPRSATVARVMASLDRADGDGRTCALDDCDEPVSRPDQLYCFRAHRAKAYRRDGGEVRVCEAEGCDGELHRANQKYCSDRCRKAAARSRNRRPGDPTCIYCSTRLVGDGVQYGTCRDHRHVNPDAISAAMTPDPICPHCPPDAPTYLQGEGARRGTCREHRELAS
jgi:hypothetical protein